MRAHLAQNITVLNDMVTDSKAQNDAAMSRDYDLAVYGVDWTGLMVPAIAQSQPVTASTYQQLVGTQTHALDACGVPCGFGTDSSSCATSSGLNCTDLFHQAAGSFGGYQAVLVQDAAPSSLAPLDLRLQGDLAQADTVLLAMNLSTASSDQTRFDSEMAGLIRIKAQIDSDAAK